MSVDEFEWNSFETEYNDKTTVIYPLPHWHQLVRIQWHVEMLPYLEPRLLRSHRLINITVIEGSCLYLMAGFSYGYGELWAPEQEDFVEKESHVSSSNYSLSVTVASVLWKGPDSLAEA